MRPTLERSTIALAATLLAAHATAQTTELVSRDSLGVQGNQFSEHASISGDGRLVVFQSVATNLVAGDSNNSDDVFLHDRVSNVTTRVSVATGGAQASGFSQMARISADGLRVAFESGATDLVTDDTNSAADVFVRDLQSGVTTRVSVATSGVQANGVSYAPALSTTGRYVAFHSAASNLVGGDTNNAWDVFVRDRQAGTTTRVSVTSAGVQAGSSSANAAISGDGRYVAFHSGATNLVAGDTNGSWDVFVRDLQTSTTTRVSLASGAVQANGSSVNPSLSTDARYVAFHSAATNLVAADTNAREDVFVYDRQMGTTSRVSVASNGIEGNGTSRYASISGDGRCVAFESIAENLAGFDSNNTWDIFVRDIPSSSTVRVSSDPGGVEGDGTSTGASISTNGALIAFDSYASSLAPGDNNNNGDAFVHDRGTLAPYTYCTAGTTSNGCNATMSFAGTPSASASSGFTLTISAVEGLKQGIMFYGLDNAGFAASPWGTSSSFLCVKPPTQRTLVQSSGGSLGACNGVLSLDWNAFMAANAGALGNPRQAGQTIYAQGWFRDPPSPKSTMLSNATAFFVGL